MSATVNSAFKSFPQTKEQAVSWLKRSIFVTANTSNEAQVAMIMSDRAHIPAMMYGAGLNKWKFCYFREEQKNAILEEAKQARMNFYNKDKSVCVKVEEYAFYYEVQLMQGVGVDEIKPWFSLIKDENIVFLTPVYVHRVPLPILRLVVKKKIEDSNIVSARNTGNKVAWITPCTENWEKRAEFLKAKRAEQEKRQIERETERTKQIE